MFPFDDTLFTHRDKPKMYKTRAERRACHRDSREQGISREELIKAQEDELDIQQRAKQESKDGSQECCVDSGDQRTNSLNPAIRWCYRECIMNKPCDWLMTSQWPDIWDVITH